VTQGDIPPTTIFKIVVDAVIRSWTVEALEDRDAQTSSIFYADDGVLTSNDAISLQTSSDHLLSFFRRVNLEANAKKYKYMVCLPGKVQGHISSLVYDRRMIGEGELYKDRKRRKSNVRNAAVQWQVHHWESIYSNNMVHSYVPWSWPKANKAVVKSRTTKLVFHCIANPLYVQSWTALERQRVA
jgi:hypothetical protein